MSPYCRLTLFLLQKAKNTVFNLFSNRPCSHSRLISVSCAWTQPHACKRKFQVRILPHGNRPSLGAENLNGVQVNSNRTSEGWITYIASQMYKFPTKNVEVGRPPCWKRVGCLDQLFKHNPTPPTNLLTVCKCVVQQQQYSTIWFIGMLKECQDNGGSFRKAVQKREATLDRHSGEEGNLGRQSGEEGPINAG